MSRMKPLVSIPPMAKVTDIGATAQTSAARIPAVGRSRRRPSAINNQQVAASATALTPRAKPGKGAAVPPLTAASAASSPPKRGVVMPKTGSPRLEDESVPGEQVLRVAEKNVGVVDDPRARNHAQDDRQQRDQELRSGHAAPTHGRIIVSRSVDKPASCARHVPDPGTRVCPFPGAPPPAMHDAGLRPLAPQAHRAEVRMRNSGTGH